MQLTNSLEILIRPITRWNPLANGSSTKVSMCSTGLPAVKVLIQSKICEGLIGRNCADIDQQQRSSWNFAIQECWSGDTSDACQQLVESFPRRIENIIEAWKYIIIVCFRAQFCTAIKLPFYKNKWNNYNYSMMIVIVYCKSLEKMGAKI